MLAPAQIQNHRFVEFSLKPTFDLAAEDRAKRSLTCRHQFGWHHDEAKAVWLCRLRVELIQPEKPEEPRSVYTGAFEVIGEFILHPSVPSADQLKLIAMSGGAILYSSIREWVATLSARSIHGLVELPTIDARNFYSECQAALAKEASPEIGVKPSKESNGR
jgi:hypothetical protein